MAKYKVVPCPNTGKKIKVQLPPKPGFLDITCPHCGEKHRLQFGPESIDPPESVGQPEEERMITGTGIVGEEQHDPCPWCGKEMVYTPQESGIDHFQCPHCHRKVRKEIKRKTEENFSSQGDPGRGQLVVMEKTLLGIKRRHVYHLHEGSNVIGRYSEGTMSDISLKGDNYMSRRSVSIDVVQQDKGYLYRLRVLRAANPVYVNDNALMVDESQYLNFGDRIVLGKTMLTFEKKED